MVLNKHLRVFLLSIMVVLLAVSSCLALSKLGNSGGWQWVDGKISANKDENIRFDLPEVLPSASRDALYINEFSLEGAANKVNVFLPGFGDANPDKTGTIGSWDIDIKKGKNLTIARSSTGGTENSAIRLGSTKTSADWKVVGQSTNLTIDAPIKARNRNFDLFLIVSDEASAKFTNNASVFDNINTPYNATGFGGGLRSRFTVQSKATLTIENSWALAGSLDVMVSKDSTLVLNVSGTQNMRGASIDINGYIDARQNLTLTNGTIKSTSGTFTKRGTGTLTLGQGINIRSASRDKSGEAITIIVENGTLDLAGNPSLRGSFDIKVKDGAKLRVRKEAIEEVGSSFISFDVSGSGELILESRAVKSYKPELYPYDGHNYNDQRDQSMTFMIENVSVKLSDDNSKLIVDGVQPINKLFGKGVVNINEGSSASDDKVLIMYNANNANASGFSGTITGSNLGLFDRDYGTFRYNFLNNAKVTVRDLLVYGRTTLEISADSKLVENVNNIYLRSFRPGSRTVAPLTVGSLKLIGHEDFEVGAIKIDAVNSQTGSQRAKIEVDGTSTSNPLIVTIHDVEFYANKDTDFGGNYPNATYDALLRLDGTADLTRIIWSGDKVKGNGTVAPGRYPIEITNSTDIQITGERPFATGNNVKFGKNAKVHVFRSDRGTTTFGGNVEFEGSSTPITKFTRFSTIDSEIAKKLDNIKSADEVFANMSTFTTEIGEVNRLENGGGKYSVLVEGRLILPNTNNNMNIYDLLVEVLPDPTVFVGIDYTTIGQRFKVIGTDTSSCDRKSNYDVAYDTIYYFVKSARDSKEEGIIVESQKELPLIQLSSEWEFIDGGRDFGEGTRGKEFVIKIPYDVIYRGRSLFYESNDIRSSTNTTRVAHYMGVDNVNYIVYPHVLFQKYEKGKVVDVDNAAHVQNNYGLKLDVLATQEITLRAEFTYGNTADDRYIRLIGTSYKDIVDVPLSLKFYGYADASAASIATIDNFVPAYKEYKFIREGIALPSDEDQYSNSAVEVVGDHELIMNGGKSAQFFVKGMRRTTYDNDSSLPVLVNGTYVWNDSAADGHKYVLLDGNNVDTVVTNLVLRAYDGDPYRVNTVTSTWEIGIESFDIKIIGDGALVEVPVSELGTTNNKFETIKGLSLVAERDGVTDKGKILTEPVTYTLIADIASADTLPATELTQTVTIGKTAESRNFEINPDDLSGDIRLIEYIPDWLGFDGNGQFLSYTIPDTSKLTEGTYDFSVIAYSGENLLTNTRRKLYTFTITVVPAPVAHITGPSSTTIIIPETGTINLSVEDDEEDLERSWTVAALDGAPDLTPNSGRLTGNGTITLTLNSENIPEGTYNYTLTAGDLTYAFAVTVSKPEFEINEVENTFDDAVEGRTVKAIFQVSGAEGEVTWSIRSTDLASELYTAVSGDMFIVEGIARYAYDTVNDEDIEQIFVVSLTDSVRGSITPDEGDSGYVAFTPEEEDEDLTITSSADLTVIGSSSAVEEGYAVTFPSGIEVSEVYLPSWLRAVTNADDEITGIEFVGPVGDLKNGATANVFVEASNDDGDDVYYSWNVVYAAEPELAPLDVTLTPPTLRVVVGETATATLSNADLTYSSDTSWVTVSGTTVIVAPTDESLVGEHTATITASNTAGSTKPLTLAITVDIRVAVFEIAASDVNITLPESGNGTGTLTVTPTGANGAVTYTATPSAAALTVGEFTGNSATLTATASGDYTVTVNATDASGRTAEAITVNVRVNAATPPAPFTVSANPTRLTVKINETATSTLTPSIATGTTYSSDVAWVTVSGNTATAAPTDAALVGQRTVTITATNGTQRETVTLTITVEAPDEPEPPQPIVITPAARFSDENTESIEVAADKDVPATGWVVRVNGNAVEWATIESTGARTATVTLDVPSSLAAGPYAVTVSATAADGTTNTVSVGSFTVKPSGGTVGSSGGGCDAGFGALALAFAAPLFLRKRRS